MALQPSKRLSEIIDLQGHAYNKTLHRLKREVEFKSHFSDKETAAKFEHHAAKGDPYALERLYHQYMDLDATSSRLPIYGFGAALISTVIGDNYYAGIKHLDVEEAEKIKPKLNATSTNLSLEDFATSGRRMPHPSRGDGEFKGSMLPMAGLLDYLANYEQYGKPESTRAEDEILGLFSKVEIERPTIEPTMVINYLAGGIERDLNFLSSLGNAGDQYAASLLSAFYKKRDLKYQDGSFRGNFSTTPNTRYDPKKAEHWGKIQALLSGRNEDAYESYVENRRHFAEGAYDVAMAILENPHVRRAYNKRRQRQADDCSGALDMLAESADMGNANAAWSIARFWHEKYIQQETAQFAERAYSWYSRASEMGNKEAGFMVEYFNSQFPDLGGGKTWQAKTQQRSIKPESDHIQDNEGRSRGKDGTTGT